MPRIKAAVGLLAVAVFCIGFNSVRYPVVWDMVAASTATAAPQRGSESANANAAAGQTAPAPPLASIAGSKPAKSPDYWSTGDAEELPGLKTGDAAAPADAFDTTLNPLGEMGETGDRSEAPLSVTSDPTPDTRHLSPDTPPPTPLPRPPPPDNSGRAGSNEDRAASKKDAKPATQARTAKGGTPKKPVAANAPARGRQSKAATSASHEAPPKPGSAALASNKKTGETTHAASQSGSAGFRLACTGSTCNLARDVTQPRYAPDDLGVERTDLRERNAWEFPVDRSRQQEPSSREGQPAMVPVVAGTDSATGSYAYEHKKKEGFSLAYGSQDSSLEGYSNLPDGGAEQTIGSTAWDRASWPGTRSPTISGNDPQVRRLPPPDPLAEDPISPLDPAPAGSIPIYPVTHRP